MEWSKITPRVLKKAAQDGLVAIIPVGSMEAHAGHLPLGNDTFKVDRVCIDAAEREPAVVLPPLFFTDTASMLMTTGAISVRLSVLQDLVTDLCADVARHGFKKIIIVSGHGGNGTWLGSMLNRQLTAPGDYLLYSYYVNLLGGEENRALMTSAFDGHGGEVETSIALHLFPELVDMADAFAATQPAEEPDLGGAITPYEWVIRWPKAVSGDPMPATAEKGKLFYEANIRQLVECLQKVKADMVTPRFRELFEKQRQTPRLQTPE